MADRPTAAVCFDAGNTLVRCDPPPAVIYADALSRHGRPVSPDEVGPVFAMAWAEMQLRTPPGADRYSSVAGGERAWWGSFVREVLRRLDHEALWRPLLDELYAAFSRAEVWKAYPDALPTLEALRQRGLRLAVISNWDRRLPEILDWLELAPLFEVVAVSSLEGVEKPAPEIFARTLDRLGVEAADAMHVGDSPREDYQGAADAGLIPVLVDRRGLFEGDGYRRVASLEAVVELIDEP